MVQGTSRITSNERMKDTPLLSSATSSISMCMMQLHSVSAHTFLRTPLRLPLVRPPPQAKRKAGLKEALSAVSRRGER